MGQASAKYSTLETLNHPSEMSSNSDFQTTSGYFPISDLPDDTLAEVLLRVSGKDLVKSCVLVCKRWKVILDFNTLWKEKCKKEFYYTDQLLKLLVSSDFKKLYFKNPYNQNLIKNCNAVEGLKYWEVISNGGDGFITESVPGSCHPLSNYITTDTVGAAVAEGAEVPCWATSYGDCCKEQVIDLIKRGCSEYVLDNIKPDICVSEWYASLFPYGNARVGIEYMLEVQLLKGQRDSKPIAEWSFKDTKAATGDWLCTGSTLSNYPSGLRFIKYKHSGKDKQFWAGPYGAKFTLSTVKFDFTHTAGPN